MSGVLDPTAPISAQKGPNRTNDRLVPYRPLSRRNGVESQTRDAIESGDLASYRLGVRWRYVWESDFYNWLESRRISVRSADPAERAPLAGIGGGV